MNRAQVKKKKKKKIELLKNNNNLYKIIVDYDF